VAEAIVFGGILITVVIVAVWFIRAADRR